MKTQFKTLIHKSPETVRDKIFTLLDQCTQLKLRTVCKTWKRIIDQVLPLKVILNEQSYRYLQRFIRSHKVGELVIGYFSQPYPPNGWKIDPEAVTLLSDHHHCSPSFSNIKSFQPPTTPSLSSLEILPADKLEKLFTEFSSMKRLTVASSALVDIKRDNSFLRKLEFSRLKCLELIVEETHGLPAIQDILSQTYPNLGKISISMKNDDDLTLYADVYSFVGRHPMLTEVKRTISSSFFIPSNHFDRKINNNNNEEDDASPMFMQVDHRLDPVLYADVLEGLGKVDKLTHLNIDTLRSEGQKRKNLELQLFRAQVSLHTLELHKIRRENMPVWRTVPAILRQCSATLKSVLLDGCFCDCKQQDRPGPFWCHWVEQCNNLERLEVLVCGIKIVDVSVIPKDNLKVLCLGHALTQRQMKTICETFTHLEELSLPQMNYAKSSPDIFGTNVVDKILNSEASNRMVTLFQFKRALTLQNLKKLSLSTKSCSLKSIRKFAGGLMGIYESPVVDSTFSLGSDNKRGDLEYTIDRTLFCYP